VIVAVLGVYRIMLVVTESKHTTLTFLTTTILHVGCVVVVVDLFFYEISYCMCMAHFITLFSKELHSISGSLLVCVCQACA